MPAASRAERLLMEQNGAPRRWLHGALVTGSRAVQAETVALFYVYRFFQYVMRSTVPWVAV